MVAVVAPQEDEAYGPEDQDDADGAREREGLAEDADADRHGRQRFERSEERGQRGADAFDGPHVMFDTAVAGSASPST